jgi:hypothetical protein
MDGGYKNGSTRHVGRVCTQIVVQDRKKWLVLANMLLGPSVA